MPSHNFLWPGYFLSAIAVQYLLLVLSLFYSLEITVRIDFQFTYRHDGPGGLTMCNNVYKDPLRRL